MRRALALMAILAGIWASLATADGGGPLPGPSWGGAGKVDPTGAVRYVAVPAGEKATIVEVVRIRDGNVLRWTYLRGLFGIPMVAWDGSMGGLARDGRNLVLESATFPGSRSTRFVLLDPRSLRVRGHVRLRGSFAFDALSPDGSLMYLIQYLGRWRNNQPYAVRVFNWNTLKLYAGAIVDRREPSEKMTGTAVTRVGSGDGGWAYTLYQRQRKTPFVHALDTEHRRAFCVDLPWRNAARWLGTVKMRVRGRQLELRRDHRTIAVMDTRTFDVRRR